MIARHRILGVIVLVLALGACTSPAAVGSSAPSPPASSPSPSAGPSPSASPSPSPSLVAPSASATTACLARSLYDLLRGALTATGIEALSAAQRAEIAAALESYNFGTNATALSWRDALVAALKAGSFPNQPTRDIVITQFLAGQSGLKACP